MENEDPMCELFAREVIRTTCTRMRRASSETSVALNGK